MTINLNSYVICHRNEVHKQDICIRLGDAVRKGNHLYYYLRCWRCGKDHTVILFKEEEKE